MPPARRAPALIPVAPALVAAVVLAAGCGDDGGDGEEPPPASAGQASALELTLDADGPGGEVARAASVECPGDPECELVDALSVEDLAQVPAGAACTEIYGGPDALEVSGTLEGEPVGAELTRENGCQIERFDVWAPLLQELLPGYEPGASVAASG